MWVQADFAPDLFWLQTPRHYQLAMRGVRRRLEGEARARAIQAHATGAFGGLAHHGKLKALSYYERKASAQSPGEMIAAIKAMGAKSNMKIRRIGAIDSITQAR